MLNSCVRATNTQNGPLDVYPATQALLFKHRRLLAKTMHSHRSTATAPVWARDHFEIVAVGIGKIDPASAVVMIDLARAATSRVGPVLETPLAEAAEDSIEISLGNQESVVLWLDWSIGGPEIERHSVVEFDHLEGAEPDWRRQPKYLGQKTGGQIGRAHV